MAKNTECDNLKKIVDKILKSNDDLDRQIQSQYSKRRHRKNVGNDMKYKTCDSLFSSCCDKCKKRKLLKDKLNDILVPVPVLSKDKSSPAGRKMSPVRAREERNEPRLCSQDCWDMWRGRTVELDISKTQTIDENKNGWYNHMYSYGRPFPLPRYLPYRKQQVRTPLERMARGTTRVPLYRRGSW